MMTALNTFLALAIPWYAGIFITAALFPDLPPLGRVGIGWGVGLGGVTWLMFGLSLVNIPFTSTAVGIALLLCVVGFAWIAPRDRGVTAPKEAHKARDAAPFWLRWPIIS